MFLVDGQFCDGAGVNSTLSAQRVSLCLDTHCSHSKGRLLDLSETERGRCSFALVSSYTTDGSPCAGSGWQFIPPYRTLGEAQRARIAPTYGGEMRRGALYGRSLRVSEGVASYRAQRQLNQSIASPIE